MEYFPLKDLEQYTISRTLNEDEIKKIAYDLLVGLSIMHAEGIVHRDLKPEVSLPTSEERFEGTDYSQRLML